MFPVETYPRFPRFVDPEKDDQRAPDGGGIAFHSSRDTALQR